MNAAQAIALLAACAAVASAIFAFRNSRIASRALALNRAQREDRDRDIDIYLIDSFLRRRSSTETLAFAITLINKSDIANSIVRMDVEVHNVHPDGSQSHLLFASTPCDLNAENIQKLPLLSVPVSIGPRNAVSGWAAFQFERTAISGRRDHYSVVAITALGKRVQQDVFLMREILDEPAEDPK